MASFGLMIWMTGRPGEFLCRALGAEMQFRTRLEDGNCGKTGDTFVAGCEVPEVSADFV